MSRENQLEAIRTIRDSFPLKVYERLVDIILETPELSHGPKPTHEQNIIEFNAILSIVGKICEVEPGDIISKTRVRGVVDAKSIVMWHAKPIFKTLEAVALQFNGMNHTGVIYHKNRYMDLYEVDAEFRERAKMVNKIIYTKK